MGYRDKHHLSNGRVLLYRRGESPVFYARFKIDGHKGYLVRSTKETELPLATRVAEDLFVDFSYKARHGQVVHSPKFSELWKKWAAVHQSHISIHRKKYIFGTANRYFLPFFGSMKLSEIDDATIQRYWDWRQNYWQSEAGVEKIDRARKSRPSAKHPHKSNLGNVARTPANKSLQMEQTVLKTLFRWANRYGLVQQVPEIRAPKAAGSPSVVRRPAFTLAEWRALYKFMRRWCGEKLETDEDRDVYGRPNASHLYQRNLLRNYVLFMVSSGLRPNEARQLRWKDITQWTDGTGAEHTLVYVPKSTKTGAREVITLRFANRALSRIRGFSAHTDAADLVFCDSEGRAISNFGKTFKGLLTKSGLLHAHNGDVRTIYSLRHTYATLRLLYGKVPIEDLAQVMGTSPATIYAHYRHVTVRQRAELHSGTLNKDLSSSGLYF